MWLPYVHARRDKIWLRTRSSLKETPRDITTTTAIFGIKDIIGSICKTVPGMVDQSRVYQCVFPEMVTVLSLTKNVLVPRTCTLKHYISILLSTAGCELVRMRAYPHST